MTARRRRFQALRLRVRLRGARPGATREKGPRAACAAAVRPAESRSTIGLVDIREQASELRARADAARDDIAAERAELERRAGEAAALDAEARRLDAEQDRADRIQALFDQADEHAAAAEVFEAQAAELDATIAAEIVRAAQFEARIVELAGRRQTLVAESDQAARAGDADALLDAERETAAMPAVEQRLREQAEAAIDRTDELISSAIRAESMAYHHRRQAVLVRRHAETSPEVPFDDPEGLPADELERWGGRRSPEFRGARVAAISAVRETPDLASRDAATVAAMLDRERRAALQRGRAATWTTSLGEVSELVERVREAGRDFAAPVELAPQLVGTLEWHDPRDPLRLKPQRFDALRASLADAVAAYEERVRRESLYREQPWPGAGVLSRCTSLAISRFRFVENLVDGTQLALDEVTREIEAITGAAADGFL